MPPPVLTLYKTIQYKQKVSKYQLKSQKQALFPLLGGPQEDQATYYFWTMQVSSVSVISYEPMLV